MSTTRRIIQSAEIGKPFPIRQQLFRESGFEIRPIPGHPARVETRVEREETLVDNQRTFLRKAIPVKVDDSAGPVFLRGPRLAKQSDLGEVRSAFQLVNHHPNIHQLREDEVVFEVKDELDVIGEGIPTGLDCAG
jgi:hypothetical protein